MSMASSRETLAFVATSEKLPQLTNTLLTVHTRHPEMSDCNHNVSLDISVLTSILLTRADASQAFGLQFNGCRIRTSACSETVGQEP